MSEPKKEQKKRLWVVDPSMYKSEGNRSKIDHVRDLLVPLGRTAFVIVLFSYPLLLVYLGIVFGGVAFWGTLAGTFLALGLFLWKTGYARHFEAWNTNFGKQIIGLLAGFLIVLGVYEGVFHLGFWILPLVVAGGIGVLVAIFGRD